MQDIEAVSTPAGFAELYQCIQPLPSTFAQTVARAVNQLSRRQGWFYASKCATRQGRWTALPVGSPQKRQTLILFSCCLFIQSRTVI